MPVKLIQLISSIKYLQQDLHLPGIGTKEMTKTASAPKMRTRLYMLDVANKAWNKSKHRVNSTSKKIQTARRNYLFHFTLAASKVSRGSCIKWTRIPFRYSWKNSSQLNLLKSQKNISLSSLDMLSHIFCIFSDRNSQFRVAKYDKTLVKRCIFLYTFKNLQRN